MDLPGGERDEGETPMQAAERELLEETGYRGNMRFLTQSYECGHSPMYRYCFVATDCEKVGKMQLDEGECIETVEMNLYDFREHLRSGKLTDIEVGYLGLDYLGLL